MQYRIFLSAEGGLGKFYSASAALADQLQILEEYSLVLDVPLERAGLTDCSVVDMTMDRYEGDGGEPLSPQHRAINIGHQSFDEIAIDVGQVGARYMTAFRSVSEGELVTLRDYLA